MTEWLSHITERGFKAIVVSNNPIKRYTEAAELTLNMPVIGNAKKPRRKFLYQAAEMLNLPPSQIAVVGDRPLTDILGGHRMGAKTILVDPLNKQIEHRIIQGLRRLERLFIIH